MNTTVKCQACASGSMGDASISRAEFQTKAEETIAVAQNMRKKLNLSEKFVNRNKN